VETSNEEVFGQSPEILKSLKIYRVGTSWRVNFGQAIEACFFFGHLPGVVENEVVPIAKWSVARSDNLDEFIPKSHLKSASDRKTFSGSWKFGEDASLVNFSFRPTYFIHLNLPFGKVREAGR
jgi:hypothetical protein